MREDQGRLRVLDVCSLQVLLVGRVAAHEVDGVTGRVPFGVGDDDDLLLVVVAAQLWMRSRAVGFQPQTTMWSWYPDAPKP